MPSGVHRAAVAHQVGVGERRRSAGRSRRARSSPGRRAGRPSSSRIEARQVARALVVQALLAEAAGRDVAVVIEDGERVAVLEHARPLVRRAGRRPRCDAGLAELGTSARTTRFIRDARQRTRSRSRAAARSEGHGCGTRLPARSPAVDRPGSRRAMRAASKRCSNDRRQARRLSSRNAPDRAHRLVDVVDDEAGDAVARSPRAPSRCAQRDHRRAAGHAPRSSPGRTARASRSGTAARGRWPRNASLSRRRRPRR